MDRPNTAAENYDRVQCHYQCKTGQGLIDKLFLQRGNVALDLGCRTGELSRVLAERVGPEGKVVGVDPNTKRLEVAKRKFIEVNNLEFAIGSSEGFPSGPYDVVFANMIMQRIERKKSIFQKVYVNLKVGGIFAFVAMSNKCWK